MLAIIIIIIIIITKIVSGGVTKQTQLSPVSNSRLENYKSKKEILKKLVELFRNEILPN